MKCNTCDYENEASFNFCSQCGSPLLADDDKTPSHQPMGIESISKDLTGMRRLLIHLSDRVQALEKLPREPNAPKPQKLSSRTEEQTPSIDDLKSKDSSEQKDEVESLGKVASGSKKTSKPSGVLSLDFERILGLNWLAIIGSLALVIGIAFFLAIAFDNNWIDEKGRVALGIVTGLALIGISEYAHRNYPMWAQPVSGAAIGVLYVSIVAAYGLYDLISPILALLFLCLVVIVGVLTTIRRESLVMAIISMIAAFLTPVLMAVSSGVDHLDENMLVPMIVYVLLIDVGILSVSIFRRWRWFILVSMLLSYLMVLFLLDDLTFYDSDNRYILSAIGIASVFLIFGAAGILFHLVWRRVPGPQDLTLMVLNAASAYLLTVQAFWENYQDWFGVITLLASLLYGLVGYGAIARRSASPQVAIYSLAIAVIFLTVAIPLQLTGAWVTVAWAAEGAVLIWAGLLLGQLRLRIAALGILALVAVRLMATVTLLEMDAYTIFLNERFLTFVVSIVSFSSASYLYYKHMNSLAIWEKDIFRGLAGIAGLFAFWIIGVEVISQFSMEWSDYRYAEVQVIAATFAILGFGLFAASLKIARVWVVGLVAMSLGALVFISSVLDGGVSGDVSLDNFKLILNFQFLVSAVLLLSFKLSAWPYWRGSVHAPKRRKYILSYLFIMANVFVYWILSSQTVNFFDYREISTDSNLASAKELSLTLIWAVYGLAVIGAGFIMKSSRVRLAGLALLFMPVFKLFLVDIFLLEQVYRVVGFVTLGLLFLAAGLLYNRYNDAIKGILFDSKS